MPGPYTEKAYPITLPAGADLSGNVGRGVVLNASGQVVVNTTLGGALAGILMPNELGDAAGKATSVLTSPGSVVEVQIGSAVAAGDPLSCAADGDFETAAATEVIVAYALQAGSADGVKIAALYVGHGGVA